jgi:hypothetical protein
MLRALRIISASLLWPYHAARASGSSATNHCSSALNFGFEVNSNNTNMKIAVPIKLPTSKLSLEEFDG